jgi:hypothetical protein
MKYYPCNDAGRETKYPASVLTKEGLFPRTSWFTCVFKVAMAPAPAWLCTTCHRTSHQDAAASIVSRLQDGFKQELSLSLFNDDG